MADAGWYPNPENPNQMRYWDGQAWTNELRELPISPPPPPSGQRPLPPPGGQPLQQPSYGATPPEGNGIARDGRPLYKKKRFIIPVSIFAFFFLLSRCDGEGDTADSPTQEPAVTATQPVAQPAEPTDEETPSTDSEEITTEEETAEPTTEEAAEETTVAEPPPPARSEYGDQPSDQAAFIQASLDGQTASRSADNDLALGAALRDRTAALCATVPNYSVSGWTGKVTNLDANGDGKGVVEVEIADDVFVKTWNNAFSDMNSNTLIEPTDPLFDQVLSLSKGQVVQFSGSFFADDVNCVQESSLTLSGNLRDPEFIFQFTEVTPLD